MSHVQTKVNDAGYEGNGATTAINSTSGNALVTACSVSGGPVTAISDNFGNLWVPHPSGPLTTGGGQNFYCWYALNITGGTGLIVTFTDSSGGQKATVISEFSGRSKTAIDQQSGTTTASSNTQTGPTLTGVAALADILAIDLLTFAGSSVTWTAGSGYTIPSGGNVAGSTNMPACVEYKNAVSAGNYTPSFINNSTGQGGFFALSLPIPAVAALQQSSLSSMNLGPC